MPVDSGTKTWTWPVGDVADLFGGAYEGLRTVGIRGSDRFGKLTSMSFGFTVDTTAPVVTITAPAAADWLSGVAGSVQGTASDDGSGVSQVRFWVGGSEDVPPVDVEDWSIASGTTSWNGSFNLSALGEGVNTVHVSTRDAAGNWSTVLTGDFGIDRNPPSVTETTIGSANAARNEEFTLGGLAADTNALASLTVTQAKGAGAAEQIFSGPLSGTSQSWEVPGLPRDPFDLAAHLLEDGVYTYMTTVTDEAGKTAVIGSEIKVDLTGPQVAISNPAAGISIQGTALSINGTAEDVASVSAIAEVRYHVTIPRRVRLRII